MRVTGLDDDGPLETLEWWRIVEIEPSCRARLIFIDERVAEDFAAHLAAERSELVLLEHWRDGERVDVRIVLWPRPG